MIDFAVGYSARQRIEMDGKVREAVLKDIEKDVSVISISFCFACTLIGRSAFGLIQSFAHGMVCCGVLCCTVLCCDVMWCVGVEAKFV